MIRTVVVFVAVETIACNGEFFRGAGNGMEWDGGVKGRHHYTRDKWTRSAMGRGDSSGEKRGGGGVMKSSGG